MHISDKERAPRHDSEKNINVRVIDKEEAAEASYESEHSELCDVECECKKNPGGKQKVKKSQMDKGQGYYY